MTCIYGNDIYLGFIHISAIEQKTVEAILEERDTNGTFENLTRFTKRVGISLEQLRLLIRIGAFRFTGKTKKELLWEAHFLLGSNKKTLPQRELFDMGTKKFTLPELHYAMHEDAFDETEILGFSLSSPFELLKAPRLNDIRADKLLSYTGKNVSITGYLVHVKNTRTVNGKTIHFGTFIDENGHFIDTTHFPPIAEKYPFRGRGCYRIRGKVVEEFRFPSIEVEEMEKLEVVMGD